MQAVILAGGLGTRLRPVTEKIPKSMIMINSQPFLQYQIELLQRNGIDNVVLCVGYLGSRIKEYFGNGKEFGVYITYSEEKGKLLGTGGALRLAEPWLADKFFLLYGDSYLNVDYGEIYNFFKPKDKLGLMTVYQNFDQYDKSNTEIADDLVLHYDKKKKTPLMTYIDAGVSLLKKESLSLMPDESYYPLEKFYQVLVFLKEMLAYPISQRFYEIGSLSGLEEFRNLMEKGVKV